MTFCHLALKKKALILPHPNLTRAFYCPHILIMRLVWRVDHFVTEWCFPEGRDQGTAQRSCVALISRATNTTRWHLSLTWQLVLYTRVGESCCRGKRSLTESRGRGCSACVCVRACLSKQERDTTTGKKKGKRSEEKAVYQRTPAPAYVQSAGVDFSDRWEFQLAHRGTQVLVKTIQLLFGADVLSRKQCTTWRRGLGRIDNRT